MAGFIPVQGRRRVVEPLIAAFQAAGATDPSMARPLQELGLEETGTFQRLAEDGLFRSTAPGQWYLDLEALSEFRDRQRLRALVMLAVGLAAAVIGALVSHFTRARP
jgi:hypothetical protein